MNREDRAKQFLSFDAMKGLDAAMRRMEERMERVERVEVGEDDAREISDALSQLTRGDSVRITYFRGGHYPTTQGKLKEISPVKRTITLEGEVIPFDDVIAIERS